jgi:hypothetical protein
MISDALNGCAYGGVGTRHQEGHLVADTYTVKSKAVPLHAMVALGGKGGIASTHS